MRRYRVIILLSVISGFILAGQLVAPPPVASGANPNVGYADFSFGGSIGTGPTADKPQSKLWHNDGRWWASLFDTASGSYRIYWLDLATQQWQITSTVIDSRAPTMADILWDATAQKLYLVSGSPTAQGMFMRYSYNPASKTYTRDFAPVVVRIAGGESISLAKDSAGKLWITFTNGHQVFVSHSTTDDATWSTPFVIPGPASATNLSSGDDISSIIAYTDAHGSSIGVLWSNHFTAAPARNSSMYFAYHKDGDDATSWQPIEAIYTGLCAADDHINLKSLQSDDSGTIYAVVKTSFGDTGCGGNNNSPQIRLVVRKPNNSWSITTFGTVENDHTRPIVLLDSVNRRVYVFATSTTGCGSTAIYMKSTSMDDLTFPPGKGELFISSSTYTCVNNATSTKQTVDASTGIVVLGSDSTQRWYLHNYLALPKGNQMITFGALPTRQYGSAPFAVSATSSSGRPVSFSASGSCTVAANKVRLTGAGSCTIKASQVGDATYNAAPDVSRTMSVTKANQTIHFNPLPHRGFGDPPFFISASASSGLPVSFSASGSCTVAANKMTITGPASCTIRAKQAGNVNFNAAPDMLQALDMRRVIYVPMTMR